MNRKILASLWLAAFAVASTSNAQDTAARLPRDTQRVHVASGEVVLPKTAFRRLIQVFEPETQEGIADVKVFDKNTGNSVRTSPSGHLVLVPEFVKSSGAFLIFAKAGYDTVGPILVDPQNDTTLLVPMQKSARKLPAMVTTAKAIIGAAEDRAKSFGGRVLTPDSLAEFKDTPIEMVLRRKGMTPEATVTHRSGGRGFKDLPADCQPRVLLNGDKTAGSLLDLSNDPASNFVAVEFYRTASKAPAPFLGTWSNDCGVVVLWTTKPY